MLTKNFIQSTLINSIKNMTINDNGLAKYPFMGFSIVCQSIEILGGCFDEYDWEDRNLSELRFRLAIKKLFPKKYHQYNIKNKKIDLYRNLRCPMIHQLRPGKYIGLSERIHEKKAKLKNMHLTMQKDRLILIYEDFFKDFKNACEKILTMIDSHDLNSDKIYGDHINTPGDIN